MLNVFADGIIIPIPKGEKRIHDKCEDDRQMGFKKSSGCQHAIYSVRRIVEHFTTNGSTVNICLMDLTKAFDKINHNAFFLNLLKRGLPRQFVSVLISWYGKLSSKVRWGNSLSKIITLKHGVRQGGVLSPFLFKADGGGRSMREIRTRIGAAT